MIGKYVFENWVGGGFTGGPNGECIALPPDYLINTTVIIDSSLVITKVSDTTGHRTLYLDLNCDTLYIGKIEIVADTINATFTMKPVCPDFFSTNNDKNARQYEILDSPVIEKYIVRILEGKFIGFYRLEDGVVMEEYYEKDDDE